MTAWTPVPDTAAEMPAERSPSPISRMRAPGLADVGDQLLVARAVEHDHHEVVHVAVERPRDGLQVVRDRRQRCRPGPGPAPGTTSLSM